MFWRIHKDIPDPPFIIYQIHEFALLLLFLARISSWARMVSASTIKHRTILDFETSVFKKEKISMAGHDEVAVLLLAENTPKSDVHNATEVARFVTAGSLGALAGFAIAVLFAWKFSLGSRRLWKHTSSASTGRVYLPIDDFRSPEKIPVLAVMIFFHTTASSSMNNKELQLPSRVGVTV